MKLLRKKAFTLVETLITLGIIAIVAALTIPIVIENSTTRKLVTQYKKSLSTLNQAAIRSIAQFDMDYSAISSKSSDETCKSDTFQNGKYSLCGLFNSILSAPKYLGKYGVVKDANGENYYTATLQNSSFDNFLIFSFSDGMFIAFNPNIKNCGIGVGNKIKAEMLTDGTLNNCIAYVDVNGPNLPNREIACAESSTVFAVNTTCEVTNASIGDIFPVVFHDGVVEPATNAAWTAFLGENSKEEIVTIPTKTLAQLAAMQVDDNFQKTVLLHADEAKAAALKMYNDANVANIDSWAKQNGIGNTAVYEVHPKPDGTFDISFYKLNEAQGSQGQFWGGQSWDTYHIFVNGDKVYTNIRLRENNGKTEAYKSSFQINVDQSHNDTIESNYFEI